jgi:glutamate-5-semialdehyde dehydrogenase
VRRGSSRRSGFIARFHLTIIRSVTSWALDPARAGTVTLAPVENPVAAAELANSETSGLTAAIVAQDEKAASEFIANYYGTGAFWNQTTRLLDGYRRFHPPETGINIDRVPGPRGPVTYRDLHLQQVVVGPGVA